jgi:hypothetical protein
MVERQALQADRGRLRSRGCAVQVNGACGELRDRGLAVL